MHHFLLGLILCLLGISCSPPRDVVLVDQGKSRDDKYLPVMHTYEFPAMGTLVQLGIVHDDLAASQQAFDLAVKEFQRLELLLSRFDPDSDIARINAAAGLKPVVVSDETIDLLQRAHAIADISGGAFDISFLGAGKLYDFQRTPPRLPTKESVSQALERVDYRRIQIDADARTAFLPDAGMAIDLGGIAKGYAVDRAITIMRSQGFDHSFVNAGGDITVSGRRGSRPWHISVEHPRQPDAIIAMLAVQDRSVVTSGDYERFVDIDGKRYCHIIDPRTGYPAQACRSVTVVAPHATVADALSTAVFVLGPDQGMALINGLADTEAIIVDAQGELRYSSGLMGQGRVGNP